MGSGELGDEDGAWGVGFVGKDFASEDVFGGGGRGRRGDDG